MNTITKESIVDTIEGLEQLTNRGIQSVYIDMAIAGMRRLQASLEAEPVAWRCDSGSIANRRVVTVSKVVADSWGEKGMKVSPLYAAPPEPLSVPDEVNVLLNHLEDVLPDEAFNKIDVKTWNNVSMLSRPDVYRAAMLQGDDGNSPVVPDGLNIRAVAALREAVRNQWLKSDEFAEKIYWKNMHDIANEIVVAMLAAAPVQEAK
ncbi:hypothetical protein [Enterobacter ludwigii]|uniref:hypothetical protein n=1 Tax=Enterobacter ludwigii TaxID=299767 RepID=UPI00397496F9